MQKHESVARSILDTGPEIDLEGTAKNETEDEWWNWDLYSREAKTEDTEEEQSPDIEGSVVEGIGTDSTENDDTWDENE